MLEQRLMEVLIGAGLIAGGTLFGFIKAHRTAKEEGAKSRAQVEPIAQEVAGAPGEPGIREILRAQDQMLKVIGTDARDARESAHNSARHAAAFHEDLRDMESRLTDRLEQSDANQALEIGKLTGRVDSMEKRVESLEGLGKQVTDLRARIEMTGAMRSSDVQKSDAATGAGETPTEGGPGSARATRPDKPPPPTQSETLPATED